MALFTDHADVVQHMIDKLTAVHITATSDLEAVYYGDQGRIPKTPAAAVMAGPLSRTIELSGAASWYDLEFTSYIMLYHGLLADLQTITKATDQLATTLVSTLNVNRQMDDSGGDAQAIHSYVTGTDPGFADRGKSLFVVHRMSVATRSRELIT